MVKRMADQALEEFKEEIFEAALRIQESRSLEEALEYVFKQAHIRGQWAESKGIIE